MGNRDKPNEKWISKLSGLHENTYDYDGNKKASKSRHNRFSFPDIQQRIILDTVPASIIIFNADGIIQFVNKYHATTFSKNNLGNLQNIGNDIRMLGQLIGMEMTREFEKILDGKMIEQKNVYLREFSNGKPGYINCLGLPLMRDSQVMGGVLIQQDVTERTKYEKILQENRQRYDNVLRNTSDAVCIYDLNGNIIAVNQKFLKLLGYTKNEIRSLKIRDFHPPGALKKIQDYKEKIIQNGFVRSEIDFLKKNGKIFPAEIFSSLFVLDEDQVVQGFVRDITERKQAEQALRESEKRFRTLFEQSIDAIFIHERGKIRDVNERACRMVGYSKKQLLSMTIMDFYPPTDRDRVKKNINRKKRVFHLETKWNRRDGQTIDVEISSNIIDFKKSITQSVVRDITDRKKAEEKIEESKALYRTLAENMKVGINIIDSEYNIIMVNAALANRYGKPATAYVGKKCYRELEKRDTTCPHCPGILAMSHGETKVIETEGILPNNKRFHVKLHAVPIFGHDGTVTGFIEIAEDITKAKKTEEALRKAITAAEDANRSKSEFLANMSHEIRTPINAIMGMTGLLLDMDPNEVQGEYLEIIQRSSDALLGIINDILDFSKIEAGRMDLEILDFDLQTAMDEIVALPAVTAQKKGLEFAYEIDLNIPSLLRGDPGRLRQIILNLTSNAIKFTENGDVVIRTCLEKETEKSVTLRFSVQDTGMGIRKKDRARLFESFHQVDASSTRRYGGTGLGLAISKKLVELMGGVIGVDSAPGKGSTFWFTVVFEKQYNAKEKILIPPMDIQNKRVLVVDDNKTSLQIIQRYIEAWGFICDAAWGGEMALTLMLAALKSKAPYNIVVTDMQMPDMDGKTLGRKIKADPMLCRTQVVVLSPRGMHGDAAEMEENGFTAYLTKPVRLSQLFNCLVLALSNKTQDPLDNHQLITRHALTETKKRNIRILIVEDNTVNQKLALQLMAKFGFKADAVANGKEAVQSLEMTSYNIVLMDIQMPEMDGFEATRIIRDPQSGVNNHNIPIIAMTAYAMQGDRERCLEAGMNDYISKPINPVELFRVIEKQLSLIENDTLTD